MKPYNPAAPCPKCGGKKVQTIFQNAHRQYQRQDYACQAAHCTDDDLGRGEHLHRRCENCSYSWPEACLDAAGAAAE